MTDLDLMSRARAHDDTGRLISWTPECVGLRMAEAASVFSRTPMRIGPSGASGFWPETYLIARDLIDEQTQERVLMYARFDGDWSKFIDDATKRRLSENVQREWERPSPPQREQYSRAEEALRWPALYLADRPLLADALTLWALCIGTGASLRATLRERAKVADARMRMIGASKRQDAMPDRNFDLRLTWDRRKKACSIISEALFAAGIALREAEKDISVDADE